MSAPDGLEYINLGYAGTDNDLGQVFGRVVNPHSGWTTSPLAFHYEIILLILHEIFTDLFAHLTSHRRA